jgi:hypothetical protein
VGIFLFLVLCLAFAGLIVWLLRKNRRLTEQRDLLLSVQARHAGWRYAPNPDYSALVSGGAGAAARNERQDIPFAFEGRTDGWGWRMWYDTGRRFTADAGTGGGSDGVPRETAIPSAVWVCEDLHAAQLSVMILPRWQYRFESGRVVGAIESAVSLFVDAIGGADGHDSRQAFFKRAVELKGSRPGFDQAFVVLAGPGAPRDWLDDPLQTLLLQWPAEAGRPSTAGFAIDVRFGPEGLRLSFQRPASASWPFWEQFGRLGEALAARLGPAAAGARP